MEQLNQYKRSSQGALYEKEQQIDTARVELEKVSSCLKKRYHNMNHGKTPKTQRGFTDLKL